MDTKSSPTPRAPKPGPDGEEQRDDNLDRTLEDTFPASDPPSTIPDPADADDAGGPDDEDDEP